MSPIPTRGVISTTKFTAPEKVVEKLAQIVPGVTTAKEVEDLLENSGDGSTPGPLWDDVVVYDPPLVGGRPVAGSQVVVDSELLRAARDNREDARLLFWCALQLADPRMEIITREILTDSDGHLRPDVINADRLERALADHASVYSDAPVPSDRKTTTNILSLLERCGLIVPTKHGGTITGIARLLPTRHAASGLVRLVAERLADLGVVPAPGGEIDIALGLGAEAWLGLSEDEFLAALEDDLDPVEKPELPALPSDLVELRTQLSRKGQVVLQGPPGAGKTYVARKYVSWATANRAKESRLQAILDRLPANERSPESIAKEVVNRSLTALWDIVQFHPGYDYTDFVRALVAEPHGEGVTFVARHRILSLITAIGAELDRLGADVELVLILDEINRGDIPNIFGELLYALEYRCEAVATPYAVDGNSSITVPESLHVIGTMNTADRSIAVIDYALRRRFVFLDLAASDAPIEGHDYGEDGAREAALFLAAATRDALRDTASGQQVGPSYFLAKADGSATAMEVLAARYVYEVLPLLTEYEMEGELDTNALSALRERLGIAVPDLQWKDAQVLTEFLGGGSWREVPSEATDA